MGGQARVQAAGWCIRAAIAAGALMATALVMSLADIRVVHNVILQEMAEPAWRERVQPIQADDACVLSADVLPSDREVVLRLINSTIRSHAVAIASNEADRRARRMNLISRLRVRFFGLTEGEKRELVQATHYWISREQLPVLGSKIFACEGAK
jgi:hypothetical protein